MCVTHSRTPRGISDVLLQQIRDVHSTPVGSCSDRGGDLDDVAEKGWRKGRRRGVSMRACPRASAGEPTRQDVNHHPKTRELLLRCETTAEKHGGREDEEK